MKSKKEILYTEFQKDFLNIYFTLNSFAKRCFRYLQWFAKTYPFVFPSLERIAKFIKGSTRTVIRWTDYFQRMGWLHKRKRSHQSNLYLIDDQLINLDLKKPQILERNCHITVTVFNESLPDLDNSATAIKFSDKKDRDIPHFLKINCLDRLQQQMLANEYSDHILLKAIDNARWYDKAVKKIGNIGGYLWSMGKKYVNA